MTKSTRLYEFNSWLDRKPNITVVGTHPDKAWTKVTLHCSDHDFTWSTSPGNIRPSRKGCKHCASNKFIEPFWEKYRNLSHIKIIKGSPLKGSDLITFKCSKHDHEWDMTVQSFARWKHGCQLCAQESSTLASNGFTNWKEVYLYGDRVKVHGYEHHAISYILGKGVTDLRVHGTHLVPTFKYSDRRYFPDMFIPSMDRIIEVKSLFTLGFSCRSSTKDSILKGKRRFKTLLAKREAVLKAGYHFKLLVFNKSGSLIRLPKKWWTYSYMDLRKAIST